MVLRFGGSDSSSTAQVTDARTAVQDEGLGIASVGGGSAVAAEAPAFRFGTTKKSNIVLNVEQLNDDVIADALGFSTFAIDQAFGAVNSALAASNQANAASIQANAAARDAVIANIQSPEEAQARRSQIAQFVFLGAGVVVFFIAVRFGR